MGRRSSCFSKLSELYSSHLADSLLNLSSHRHRLRPHPHFIRLLGRIHRWLRRWRLNPPLDCTSVDPRICYPRSSPRTNGRQRRSALGVARHAPLWRARQLPRRWWEEYRHDHRWYLLLGDLLRECGALICLCGRRTRVELASQGNLIAIPAEVLPRRHRGTAAMALQIGGYFGESLAALSSPDFFQEPRFLPRQNRARPLMLSARRDHHRAPRRRRHYYQRLTPNRLRLACHLLVDRRRPRSRLPPRLHLLPPSPSPQPHWRLIPLSTI